jgi:chromosomal replication initiator protein
LIFGGVGLGKTHLHAIGVEIKDKHPEKTVLYISAEIFTHIDSVRKTTEMILFILSTNRRTNH